MLFIVNAYTNMQRQREMTNRYQQLQHTQSVTLSVSYEVTILSTIISCLWFLSPKMNPTGRTFGFSHPQDYLYATIYHTE